MNRVTEIYQNEGFKLAFDMAMEKIQEYAHYLAKCGKKVSDIFGSWKYSWIMIALQSYRSKGNYVLKQKEIRGE